MDSFYTKYMPDIKCKENLKNLLHFTKIPHSKYTNKISNLHFFVTVIVSMYQFQSHTNRRALKIKVAYLLKKSCKIY